MDKEQAIKRLHELVTEYSNKGDNPEEIQQLAKDMIMFTTISECLKYSVGESYWDRTYKAIRAAVD